MKHWKLLVMALSLSLLFTACSSGRDDNKDTSSTNSQGVVDNVVSDVEDGVEDIVSGAEDIVSDVVSGAEDVVSDVTDHDESSTGSRDTSTTGALDRMQGL